MPRLLFAMALLASDLLVPVHAQQTQGLTEFPLTSVNTAQGCIAPPSGLVGWWPGDTNENDVAGGNNPSTVSGVSLVPGEVLTGLSFGTRGYMQVPSSSSLANQTFTWAAWVRPDGRGPNNDNFGNAILLQNIDATHNAVGLHWRATDNRFLFDFGDVNSEIFASTHAFPAGVFYHIAATYDGKVFTLFVNGAVEGSRVLAKTIAYSSLGWTFGSGPASFFGTGSIRTWNGVIDEIQAFNRALSIAELQSIFNAGAAGVCKGVSIGTGGILSASAFGGFTSIAPGTWIEIYGLNLAATTRSWSGADFKAVAAPTSLDGTTVTIGGRPAFIDYVSPGQVNALVPSDAPLGLQQITVTSAAGTSPAYNVTVNSVQPGLLAPPSFIIAGTPYAVAILSDGAFALPVGALPGAGSRPARPGDVITLYGVGFGPVAPDIPAGQLVQQLNNLASAFQLSIGGVPATVLYAGLAPNFTGLYQFNIVVPSLAPGNASLTFAVGSVTGPQTLKIAVAN